MYVYSEFNHGRHSLQDEFREGRPKSVVVPETIDTVRQLILQDRRVTYREIECLVGPAYIQYCMNICLSKKFVRVESHTICQSLRKRILSIGRKKCSKNTIALQKCIDLNGGIF